LQNLFDFFGMMKNLMKI